MAEYDRQNFLAWLETHCGAEVAAEIAAVTVEDAAQHVPEELLLLEETITPQEVLPAEPKPAEKKKDIRRLIDEMTIPQKIKAALFGNSTCRRLLIFDPNKIIQECVLSNAKLTINEIEEFVRNTSIDSQLLRIIAGRSSWMRSYNVKLGVVTNPKAPVDLSLKWFKFLNLNDAKQIARSKNVPQVLQVAAKKRLDDESK